MRAEVIALATNAKTLFLINGTPIEVIKVDNEGNYDVNVYCCSVNSDQSECSAKVYDGNDGEPLNMEYTCQETMSFTDWEQSIQGVLGESDITMRYSYFIVANPTFGSTIEMTDY